jgi:hypothetical protein
VRLPNADRAVIEAVKLREYLLSTAHPIGRFKARVFMALGFEQARWAELAEAFRQQHLTQDAQSAGRTPHGQKFSIRASLRGPNGRSAIVVSVWFLDAPDAAPRFVTAYPGDSR